MDQEDAKAYFLETYDAYGSDIYRFCLMKVSSREVAEDLTQEVFLRFWQTVREGTELRNARALLYTVARNLVIDWYRKKKETSLDLLNEKGIDFAGEDFKKITEHAEHQEVLRVIDTLDGPSKEALMLRFVDGLSPRDIASISGETPNAISVRLNRAIKKVQQQLQP
ncbi:MAG TPA: sigma-70 family RNA polymerase sigma factor [Candidatus Paceibacterota bacterium]|nr:sigma-70 family RNA polymerase sigma factor [Candidatus Paceibacterota bacterium]